MTGPWEDYQAAPAPAAAPAQAPEGPWSDYAGAASAAAQPLEAVQFKDDHADVTPEQASTLRVMKARGELDENAAVGSHSMPFVLRQGRQDPAEHWRVGYDGKLIPPSIDPAAMADARDRAADRFGDEGAAGHFGQGATYGWLDEATGELAALTTGANHLVGKYIRPLAAPGSMADKDFGHEQAYSPDQARRATIQAEREALERTRADHPVLSPVEEFAGAVAAPGAIDAMRAVSHAPNTLTRIAAGGLTGAATGAATGAGGANDGDRLAGARQGALVGAALGGGLPGSMKIGSFVFKGARGVTTDAMRAAVSILSGKAPDAEAAASPEQVKAATRYVQGLLSSKRITLDELRAAATQPGAEDITTAEAIGRSGVTKLAQLARRGGPTPDAVEGAVSTRAEMAPARILADLVDASGIDPAAASGQVKELATKLRAAAAPAYDEAYAAGAVDSPMLKQLLARPSLRKALSRAAAIAAEEGRDPTELGLVTTRRSVPGGGSVDEVSSVRSPTAQTWDYVKRGMDDVLDSYRDRTTGKLHLNDEGRATVGTLNALRGELVRLNPAYGEALKAGGEPLRLEQAFKDGGDWLLNPRVSAEQFAGKFADLSVSEQQAWKGGLANRLFNMAQNGGLTPGKLNAPAFRSKLQSALGADAAGEFLDRLTMRTKLLKSGARMNPGNGSQTYELGAAEGDTQAIADLGKLAVRAKVDPLGAMLDLGARGAAYAGTAGEDPATRTFLGKLLLQSPEETARILEELSQAPSANPDWMSALALPTTTFAQLNLGQ